jgi:N-acetylglucosaminyl-diphospho-decaprenol L-rhamnosyltransferase
MPENQPDLSVVIVSYNVREYLRQCLESILSAPVKASLEILVVENASTDGSLESLRSEFPQATVIESTINLGFAAGNNLAIRQSHGRYLLLLNPDTLVKPGALDALVDFLDGQPQAGAAGSRLLNPNGSLQPSCFPFPTLGRELWRLLHLDKFKSYGVYPMESWSTDTPRRVEVLQGTSLALRRSALDQVGLLDEDYFMYTEEVDLCYRLHTAGWELDYVPASQVVHYGGQSTRQTAANMFLQLYRSKAVFFRKHYGRAAVFFYKAILLVTALVRLILSPLAYLEPRPKREEHLRLAGFYSHLIRSLPQY